MQFNLNKFREALGSVSAAVGQNVGITIHPNATKAIIHARKDAFAIFKFVDIAGDAIPMNIEANYSFIRSTLAFFEGGTLHMEQKSKSLLFHTDDSPDVNYSRSEIPMIDNGDMRLDDKSGEVYTDKITVKYLSRYVLDTVHALELQKFAMTGTDIRKASFFLQTDGENIAVTATDGHRISIRAGKVGEAKYNFVIPGNALKAAVSLLGDVVVIEVPKDGKFLRMRGEDTVIILPIISESFFNLERVISESENGKKYVIPRAALTNACEMIELVSLKAAFTFSGDKVTVSGTDDIGCNEKTIPVENVSGEDVSAVLSPRFMRDALNSFSAQRVDVILSGKMCNITSHLEEGQRTKPGKAAEVVLQYRV